jgi:hypothetical protein
MLFVNVGYMRQYQGQTDDDKIRHGGKYIDTHKTGGEIYNFHDRRGFYYGFIPPYGDVAIDRLGAAPGDDSVDDVVIVWVARSVRGSVVVGWYKNATVFRKSRPSSIDVYSAKAPASQCNLLDPQDRLFRIPRGAGGMGQANRWYADQPRDERFKQAVWKYIVSGTLPYARKGKKLGGHAWQQDREKRLRVEENAMKATEKWYCKQGYTTTRVDREKVGWDLEASKREEFLRIEVKGLSGQTLSVDLTPNEYGRMKHFKASFRLSVLLRALDANRTLRVFMYSPEQDVWQDDEGRLALEELTGARFCES